MPKNNSTPADLTNAIFRLKRDSAKVRAPIDSAVTQALKSSQNGEAPTRDLEEIQRWLGNHAEYVRKLGVVLQRLLDE